MSDGASRSPAGWTVGRRAVEELLRGGAAERVDRLLLARSARGAVPRRLAELARARGIRVDQVPDSAIERIAEGAAHQGVAARQLARAPLELEDLLDAMPPDPLLVACVGVEDPRNLGAVVRSAAAAGAHGVVVPERRSASLTAGAAKAAAGALERIAVARCGRPAGALRVMQERGLQVVGLDARGCPAWSAEAPDLTGATCLVVGGEEKGLPRLVRETCDALLAFPLSSGVDSLNAAVAASLALYEAVRQRHAL